MNTQQVLRYGWVNVIQNTLEDTTYHSPLVLLQISLYVFYMQFWA